jgi:hypothetical protein
VNETQFPEPIHEEADSRTSRTDHFGQRLLVDFWHHGFGRAFLAETSEQQEDAGQSFFAGIKQLVD